MNKSVRTMRRALSGVFFIAAASALFSPLGAQPGGRPKPIGEAPTPITIGLQPIDFVVEANQHARKGALGPNVQAAVFATVTIAHSPMQGSNDRAQVFYAHGRLLPDGPDGLRGEIPMWLNGQTNNTPTPFSDNNLSLVLGLAKTGRVELQRRADGKNFLGRPASVFFAKPSARTLVIQDKFFQDAVITIALSPIALNTTLVAATPTPQPKTKKVNISQYRVSAEWRVTNADDGVMDDVVECEVFLEVQSLSLGKQKAQAISETKRKVNETIPGFKDLIVVVRSDQPVSRFLNVAGYVKDKDGASKDDPLWQYSGTNAKIDLTAPLRSIPGDGKDESADLIFTVELLEQKTVEVPAN